MKLGHARADAVAAAMRRAGISANLIRVVSFGESRPSVPTKDGLREDRNRRVEIGIDPRLPRTAIRQ
jgi:OOP family OmpA-OmpF porin